MLYEQVTPNNRYYTAYGVLKKFLDDHEYVISNFSLIKQAVDRAVIWVEDNTGSIDGVTDSEHITHFICVKLAPTQFQIWGYLGNYQQCYNSSFDYADVNTPSPLNSDLPSYTKETANQNND